MGVLITLSMNLFVISKLLKGKLFIGSQYNKWNMKFYKETKITHSPTHPTIYLIGDSHAGHYGSAMTDLAEKRIQFYNASNWKWTKVFCFKTCLGSP